jgi:hypothetical protein
MDGAELRVGDRTLPRARVAAAFLDGRSSSCSTTSRTSSSVTPCRCPAPSSPGPFRSTGIRGKARSEVRSLGEAVEDLGFVVREEGTRQYWRPLVGR